MHKGTCLVLLVVAASFAACGPINVKPWEKGNLARSHMAFDPDPLETEFNRHIYASKEGASGGYGVGGGGCGCN